MVSRIDFSSIIPVRQPDHGISRLVRGVPGAGERATMVKEKY